MEEVALAAAAATSVLMEEVALAAAAATATDASTAPSIPCARASASAASCAAGASL
jgi:hypothetical protein